MTTNLRAAAAVAGDLPTLRGESREQEFHAQLRTSTVTKDDKEFLVLDGYASTVEQGYTMYDMFGAYTEVVDRGAFDKTLRAEPDVNFLVNHAGVAMARTTAGTLELSADEQGLRSVAYLNPSRTDVRDLGIAIDDRAVDQMSFAFRITDGAWSPDYSEFRILEVDLNRGDVSAVNYGANPNTSISARAKQAFDAVEHLEGEPLRMLAARAAARLAESTAPSPLSVTFITAPPVKRGPNIRTLRARLDLE